MRARTAVAFVWFFFLLWNGTLSAQEATPSPGLTALCPSFRQGSEAFVAGKWDEALEHFRTCLEAQPDDARLNFLIGAAYEKQGDFEQTVHYWSQAVLLDPFYQEFLRDRFDRDVPGVARGLVHDHFAQKFCFGFFFISPEKIVYRSLWGFPRLGTDDSFETPLSNIARVEVQGKERGKGFISNMPQRLELHFRFKEKIKGSVDVWQRDEMKFFFGQTQISQTDLMAFAERIISYLRSQDIPIVEK